MTWIMTGTGHRIDFLSPDPDEIMLMDICIALARNHRFGGHSPVKVAQHLCEVQALMLTKALEMGITDPVVLAEIALVALLHDFPEFAVGDIPTPLKKLLGPLFAEIEARLLDCMLVKWELVDAYLKWHDLLGWADQEAVQQEATNYKMDGWLQTEGLVQTKVPNTWVPEDKTITVTPYAHTEELMCSAVTHSFIKFMHQSGRYLLVSPEWRKTIEKWAHRENTSVNEFIHSVDEGFPSFLISGVRYF